MAANIMEAVRRRKSVRTYAGTPLTGAEQTQITGSLKALSSRYDVKLHLIDNRYQGKQFGSYGMIKNPTAYLVAVSGADDDAIIRVGEALERAVLELTQMNLGTCWLGGSFKRDEFGSKVTVQEGELIPVVVSLGREREKPRAIDGLMRSVTKAGNKRAYGSLFFDGAFGVPLAKADAPWGTALEAVRLAPSASNKQPWRVVKVGERFHLYEQHAKGYARMMRFDMQLIDMGIAMAHFELVMNEQGVPGAWVKDDPGLPGAPDDCVYVRTWMAG